METIEENINNATKKDTETKEQEEIYLVKKTNDGAFEEIKEEEKTASEKIITESINIFEDIHEWDASDISPMDESVETLALLKNNTALPNYSPSLYKDLSDDSEFLDSISSRDLLSSTVHSFSIINSDMDGVFADKTTEKYKNRATLDGISFYSKDISVKSDKDDSFLDNLDNTLGIGVPIMVPLYNSGIWVAIKTIEEPAIIALKYLSLEKEKQVGASTGAAVYSNQSVLYAKDAIDLFISSLVFTNVRLKHKEDLKKLILSSDINTIYSALGQAMYPKGIKYILNCNNIIDKDKSCDSIIKPTIRLQNAQHTDYSKLSDAQLYHMAKKSPASVTVDEVRAYQDEFSNITTTSKEYALGNNIKAVIHYRVPNLEEYLIQGEFWIKRITRTASNIMSKLEKQKDNFKQQGFSTQMKTNLLGGYIHYFAGIDILKEDGDVKSSKDLKELFGAVERFSKDIKLYDAMLNDILQLIKNSTISIIGIPEYKCKKCEQMNVNTSVDEGHIFKNIIPFNVLQVLFTLGDLRFQEIQERN